jgi:hypothetical protein
MKKAKLYISSSRSVQLSFFDTPTFGQAAGALAIAHSMCSRIFALFAVRRLSSRSSRNQAHGARSKFVTTASMHSSIVRNIAAQFEIGDSSNTDDDVSEN